LVAGHVGCTAPFEQPRWGGQRVDQDPDHGIFDFPSGQPPALRAIGSGLGDQRRGDVIAIAPAFLDGV